MCFRQTYTTPARIIPVNSKLSKPTATASKAKCLFEVHITKNELDGNAKCHELMSNRCKSLDTLKTELSYCSADGINWAESLSIYSNDDSSINDTCSLSLHDIFDDYEDTDDDESIDTKIIPNETKSLRHVKTSEPLTFNRIKNIDKVKTSKPQVAPAPDCRFNINEAEQRLHINRKRNTKSLPGHLRSLMFALSHEQHELPRFA